MNLAAIAVFTTALAPVVPVGAALVLCIIAVLMLAAMLSRPRAASGTFVGRHRTRDISILAQSATVIIGRVTRSVPAPKIYPRMNDGTNPVASFGLAVMNTANNTVRGLLATDAGAVGVSGVAVQPYPFQTSSGTNYGAQALSALTAVPPGLLDVILSGPVGVYVNSADAPNVTIADQVYAWIAATSGTHIQGGFEKTPSASVASAVKAGGANTGTGTVTAGPVVDATKVINGVYQVRFTDATHFTVVDPDGDQLANGQTGVAYSDAGLGFTITAGGTAFVAGDGFDMTVAFNTIPVPEASFAGPGDATGATELLYNL